MIVDDNEHYHGLSYPFGRKPPPENGWIKEVAPGVHWLRFALPMALNHINLWLLKDGDGWTVVDTCMNMPDAKAAWEKLFTEVLNDQPITRVIATHLHPDHVGLAGWLTERFDCDLWMSRTDYTMCRMLVSDTGRPAPEAGIRFYHRAGYSSEQLEHYKQRFGGFGSVVYPLPDSYRRLVDGEHLTINGEYWQVVVGKGHAPEHITLYCPALKCLISGDQVLPRITSNVSVFPTEPEGNPLREWLTSNARIRELLPDDLLVLPAHGNPFYGLHRRLTQLIDGHERDLDTLYDFLSEPRRAVDCFDVLFQSTIKGDMVSMATGESIAHLNCLMDRRRIRRFADDEGVFWYQQLPEKRQIRIP
ncbi:MAG: MBL fold metallo-hydrolase [Proteobacteria bacterium]|jgi:glyoxylase-like metal-dependent hydrolase (beta-lactamase superfamily II)|nr:MBL fold metallo-hydrolase [Pseudomonadota bacterium]